MKNTVVIFLAFLILAVWFIYQHNNPQQPTIAPTVSIIGQRIKAHDCHANGLFQDKQCTPGAIFPNVTAGQVCVKGYAKSVRNVPAAVKRQVYADYGITNRLSKEYVIDHVVSLQLGGSNDIANLFPQTVEASYQKDKVENYLHREVCSGRMALHDAQVQIANDWLKVYSQMK